MLRECSEEKKGMNEDEVEIREMMEGNEITWKRDYRDRRR